MWDEDQFFDDFKKESEQVMPDAEFVQRMAELAEGGGDLPAKRHMSGYPGILVAAASVLLVITVAAAGLFDRTAPAGKEQDAFKAQTQLYAGNGRQQAANDDIKQESGDGTGQANDDGAGQANGEGAKQESGDDTGQANEDSTNKESGDGTGNGNGNGNGNGKIEGSISGLMQDSLIVAEELLRDEETIVFDYAGEEITKEEREQLLSCIERAETTEQLPKEPAQIVSYVISNEKKGSCEIQIIDDKYLRMNGGIYYIREV